jgi:hypothetical protein
MKLIGEYDSTLVGYPLRIGVFGNCFGAECEDGKNRQVVNIGRESLKATGVPWPIEASIAECDPRRVYVTDSRIPANAYRTKPCTIHADRKAFEEWQSKVSI